MNAYDWTSKLGCCKGVGSRVILQIMSEHNMVELECPLCTETVDLGSDTHGTYECPHCNEDFEYKPTQRNFIIDWIWEEYESSLILMKIKIGLIFFFFVMIIMVIPLLFGLDPCEGSGCRVG